MPVLHVSRMERTTQAGANFLRTQLRCGQRFATMGLATKHEGKRIRSNAYARTRYNTAMHFMGRAVLNGDQARELAGSMEKLQHKLVKLGEKRWNIVGRRLDDRIHLLAAKSEKFPVNSSASQEITELMKAELSEYFEREKHPLYAADRRCSQQR